MGFIDANGRVGSIPIRMSGLAALPAKIPMDADFRARWLLAASTLSIPSVWAATLPGVHPDSLSLALTTYLLVFASGLVLTIAL